MADRGKWDSYYQMVTTGHTHYQYDAYARDYAYEPAYEAEPVYEPAPAPAPRPERKPHHKHKPKERFFLGVTRGTSLLTYLLLGTIVACGIGALFTQARLWGLRMEVAALEETTRDKAALVNALRTELYGKMDKDEIARRAAQELNMAKPEEHQIIHVAANRHSYVNQINDEAAGLKPVGILERMLGQIRASAGE